MYTSSDQQITVTGITSETTINVYTVLGKEIFTSNISHKTNLHLPNVSAGIYIVKLQSEAGSISKKIIIE